MDNAVLEEKGLLARRGPRDLRRPILSRNAAAVRADDGEVLVPGLRPSPGTGDGLGEDHRPRRYRACRGQLSLLLEEAPERPRRRLRLFDLHRSGSGGARAAAPAALVRSRYDETRRAARPMQHLPMPAGSSTAAGRRTVVIRDLLSVGIRPRSFRPRTAVTFESPLSSRRNGVMRRGFTMSCRLRAHRYA